MITQTTDYAAFLAAKVALAEQDGFDCEPGEVSPAANPHQVDTIRWLVRGGRRANFSAFGLGKTLEQLEVARIVLAKIGRPDARALIVCPLGVRQEFARDATELLGWPAPPRFIRRLEDITTQDTEGGDNTQAAGVLDGPPASSVNGVEMRASQSEQAGGSDDGNRTRTPPIPPAAGVPSPASRIYLTNYESVRDGRLDPADFDVVLLDEAAVLRGFGGSKTFREMMLLCTGDGGPTGRQRDKRVRYRFVSTATPAPNDYIEILAYAEFLGIMDISQAKTRFFKRDSTKADRLTLHPHKEAEFWLWVSSWALFVTRPSDLGHSDAGYEFPALEVHWHEVATDHSAAGFDAAGQGKLFANAAISVSDAAAEKRRSLPARIDKLLGLRAAAPDEHLVIWHDLEDERHAIQAALPEAVSVWGSQDLDERERRIVGFSRGEFPVLSTKPQIAGAGTNLQKFCHRAVFFGIGFKFYLFIQAIHRLQRFGQTFAGPVRIDILYTEAEREVRAALERKWRQHNVMVSKMTEIIRKYGLSAAAMARELGRKLGVERVETVDQGSELSKVPRYRIVNNDCVDETRRMADASVDLVLTSIPFSTQYEYSPNYADFGHTENNDQFFAQMDYLTPELLRVLAPGRIAAIHVKDRIVPGGMTGLGFQTVYPFHARCIEHYTKFGFAYMGMITVVTDVVRENNQTYRLGWTRQCTDATCMGVGMPEYILLFRKPTSDPANSYADRPVAKSKEDYSRSRWQIDAHGFWRSSGDRMLSRDELAEMPHRQIFRAFKSESLARVYDFEHHVRLCEGIELDGRLPTTFMLLQPQSWAPEVWADVTRMLTLNSRAAAKGLNTHLCPLQFDICDRIIARFTLAGETVYDPFAGIGTVPFRAIKANRVGVGCELNTAYWADACAWCRSAVEQVDLPSLFDFEGAGDVEALDQADAEDGGNVDEEAVA